MKTHRTGRFTSSSIHKLVKKGQKGAEFSAPGLTYIKEKRMEKLLGRSADDIEVYSRAIAWGNIMEKFAWLNHFKDWSLISNDYRFHPSLGDVWSGIPDLEKPHFIGEIKCYQLKKFALYSDCLMRCNISGSHIELKNEFPQEYWQIVSNAVINNVEYGVAISFMPYREELKLIQEAIEETDILDKFDFDPWKYRFLTELDVDELPYIEKGGYFKNVTTYSFVVPEEDKKLLYDRVITAKEYLEK